MAVLLRNGVPWDKALEMTEAQRLGFMVAFGETQGHEFDWDAKEWRRPA